MKIIAYGVRGDEVAYMQQWAQETGNQLTLRSELLTADTAGFAQGHDGINCLQTTPYDAALFARLGELGIRYLTIRNVGTDNIDFVAAAKAGVTIANTPAYSPNAIAEFAVTLTLSLLRRLGEVATHLHQDDYQTATTFIGRELAQQTVGVIGAGRIGQAAIRIFSGFGARVLVYDPHPVQEPHLTCEYVSLQELLRRSDVVDLHIPGTPANTHVIDAAAIALMKPDALLINTARGNLVDTEALLAALRSGRLGGAGIDTFENESAALTRLATQGHFDDPLWTQLLALDNVVLAPHIAYYTKTAVRNMCVYSLNYLMELLETGMTATIVR